MDEGVDVPGNIGEGDGVAVTDGKEEVSGDRDGLDDLEELPELGGDEMWDVDDEDILEQDF